MLYADDDDAVLEVAFAPEHFPPLVDMAAGAAEVVAGGQVSERGGGGGGRRRKPRGWKCMPFIIGTLRSCSNRPQSSP